MANITIGRAGEPGLHSALLDSMFRLRHDIFHARLGWDVRVDDGREHDWFDLMGPRYIVAHDGQSNALGCCRLLPTLGPNMLRDVFPSLLDGAPAPAGADIWEISRFAIDANCGHERFGFGEIPQSMLTGMFRFADGHGIAEIVGVTSAPVERLLRHMGLCVERLGRPRRIGAVMSLAFRMPVGENLEVVGRSPAADVARAA